MDKYFAFGIVFAIIFGFIFHIVRAFFDGWDDKLKENGSVYNFFFSLGQKVLFLQSSRKALKEMQKSLKSAIYDKENKTDQ